MWSVEGMRGGGRGPAEGWGGDLAPGIAGGARFSPAHGLPLQFRRNSVEQQLLLFRSIGSDLRHRAPARGEQP